MIEPQGDKRHGEQIVAVTSSDQPEPTDHHCQEDQRIGPWSEPDYFFPS